MKISELESILKTYREEYGDLVISFGRADDEVGAYCRCDVDIEFDNRTSELDITVF